MARPRSRKRAPVRIDEAELAAFRAGMRRRYTDDEILAELRAAAERLGRSPTMREFARDPEARVHPQTVIEHFGTWNAAKRAAGLFPRRFLTRDELLEQLRALGDELGQDSDRPRPRRARTLDPIGLAVRAYVRVARQRAPGGRVRGAAGRGAPRARRRAGRTPRRGTRPASKMADWAEARRQDPALLSEWQVYRLLDVPRGAWTAFQFLVRERLREDGVEVRPDGSLGGAD